MADTGTKGLASTDSDGNIEPAIGSAFVPTVEPVNEPADQLENDDRILIEWLSNHDESCPVCSYNLRGLYSGRCPECGWALQLRVGAKDWLLASWVATIVSLCIGAGLGIPSAIILVMSGGEIIQDEFVCGGLCMVWFSLCIPLAVIVLIGKRRFISQSADAQRGWAVFAGIVTGFAVIGILANIFGGR